MYAISVRVSADPTCPMRQAILSVGGLPRALETFEFALSRHEFVANHLGLEGWQGAECWLQPEEAWYSGDILMFVVAPNLVFQLENMPYQLALRGPGLAGTVAAMFVWPLELERDAGIHADAEPTNERLPVLMRSPRRVAVEEDLPTRVVLPRARTSRSSPLNATDDEPTRRVPGRRIPATGNGGRKSGGEAVAVETPSPSGPPQESPAPVAAGPEARRESPRLDLAGRQDERRRRYFGLLWVGLMVFGVAVAGWWWRSHPPAEVPTSSDPSSLETPPDAPGSIWLRPAPEPVPAPEPTPAPEPVPAPEPTPAPEPIPAPASRPAAPTHAGIAK